jgi:hypothetical protein
MTRKVREDKNLWIRESWPAPSRLTAARPMAAQPISELPAIALFYTSPRKGEV